MKQIVLVEDNPLNCDVIEDIFEFDEIGAELVIVGSGEEGLELARALHPVLMLMDVRLPGMDGLEVTKLIKADPETQDIEIWAITAHAMKGDAQKALEAGCSQHITKPINSTDLALKLRSFLGQGTCEVLK
jgi:CheY-like chemotaxis protein